MKFNVHISIEGMRSNTVDSQNTSPNNLFRKYSNFFTKHASLAMSTIDLLKYKGTILLSILVSG